MIIRELVYDNLIENDCSMAWVMVIIKWIIQNQLFIKSYVLNGTSLRFESIVQVYFLYDDKQNYIYMSIKYDYEIIPSLESFNYWNHSVIFTSSGI